MNAAGRLLIALASFSALLAACTERAAPSRSTQAAVVPAASAAVAHAAPAGAGNAERGRELVRRHECSRCHELAEVPRAAFELDCVNCHRQILAGSFPAKAELLARWKPQVTPMRALPSLVAIGRRLRPEWVASYLVAPYDVRPLLAPNMPRLGLAAADARDIAEYLAEHASPRGDAAAIHELAGADVKRGRALLEQRACGGCHAFSGVPALPQKPDSALVDRVDALVLAPDLRHVRDRWAPGALVRWLRDPRAEKPDTAMPPTGFDENQARDVAAYLLSAPREAVPPREAPRRLPALERAVSFAEVDEQVFRRTCRHCHGDPNDARGDGGPGNTGGFGYAGKGIDFSSYRAIASGYRHAGGERHSLFEAGPDGTPRLVLALLARHDEEAGRPRRDVLGMPLGLPALSPEQIQLVDTWIAQGRPR